MFRALARPPLRAATRLFGPDLLVRTLHTLAAWRSGARCLGYPYVGAVMLAYLGDQESTVRCLEESVDRGRFGYIKAEPLLEPYRDDPRFQALLAGLELPD